MLDRKKITANFNEKVGNLHASLFKHVRRVLSEKRSDKYL